MRTALLALILLLLLALLIARPAPSRAQTGYPCGYGWPGSSYPYCIDDGNPTLTASTWRVPDGTVSISVCATPERYGEIQRLRLVWSEASSWTNQTRLSDTLLIYTPTAEAHCLHWRGVPDYAAPGIDWEPDIERWHRRWWPMVYN